MENKKIVKFNEIHDYNGKSKKDSVKYKKSEIKSSNSTSEYYGVFQDIYGITAPFENDDSMF